MPLVLTLDLSRSPGHDAFEPVFRRIATSTRWPIERPAGQEVREGEAVLLRAVGFGIWGDAVVAESWHPWSPAERRLLGELAGESSGGLVLWDVTLWPDAVPTPEWAQMPPLAVIDQDDYDALRAGRMHGDPWRPSEDVASRLPVAALAWIVIDELHEHTAVLELSRWPRDERGSPVFLDEPQYVEVDRASLEGALDGDVAALAADTTFAAMVDWDVLTQVPPASVNARDLIFDPVEITGVGRVVAEEAFSKAILGDVPPAANT